MRPRDTSNDPLQGEGDRISARHYNRDLREFIAEGNVDEAAQDAAAYVERGPEDAERAEQAARRGPRNMRGIVHNLMSEGKSLFEHYRQKSVELVRKLRRK